MPSPRAAAPPPAAPVLPDPAALALVRIVLVRPRGAANIGATARAMKNMGLADLVLVQPALRRPAAAERMAVHARDLIGAARLAPSVADAIADCRLVVGTTCRGGGYRRAVESPADLAPVLLDHARHGPVAVLFGPEDHGLSNEDIGHCQRLIAVDTSAAYRSLNLAQAVLLICYELRHAALGEVPAAAVAPAPAAVVEAMLSHLQGALARIGFLNPQNPEHIMFALRRLFGRTALEPGEVRMLRGIARQMEWAAGERSTPPAAACAARADDAEAQPYDAKDGADG